MTQPRPIEPYGPCLTIEGKYVPMVRGENTIWVPKTFAGGSGPEGVAWKNGDEANASKIEAALDGGNNLTMTEISQKAQLTRVCTTRLLKLMVHHGIVSTSEYERYVRYSLTGK